MAGTVPVVAAISLIAKPTLVRAVKEKATAFVVLPAKRQTIRETLQAVALFADEAKFPSGGKKILGTDIARRKTSSSSRFSLGAANGYDRFVDYWRLFGRFFNTSANKRWRQREKKSYLSTTNGTRHCPLASSRKGMKS